MILNEQGFWRLAISLAMGAAAAVAASFLAVFVKAVRRDVGPEVPLTAGAAVAVTAYLIDWYTERKGA